MYPCHEKGNTNRNLLAQEFQILLAVLQARLRGRKLVIQHSLRLAERVRKHDIRSEPEVNLLRISGGDRSAGVEGIIKLEVRLEVCVGI
jgi:hypothetical protein